ncbi:MAG TPA: AraC family transcriptional regulator [Polyangiales bacterium]|nr:AraC family transcriptional regulator [Polyangiales bacterium]
MVSTRVLRNLVDCAASAGVSPAGLLRGAGLDAECLQALDARLPRAKLHQCVALALDLTSDPAFGLHSIERLSSDALDPLAGLVAHAASLQQALGSIQDFRRLLGDQASFRVYEDSGKVFVKCARLADEPPRVQRFMAEVCLGGLYLTIRRFRATAHVDLVAFEYGAPDYQQEYARVFEGRARFEQPFTGLCFDAALLAAPAPQPDAELHQALRVFATRRIAQLTDKLPYSARVLDVLVWRRPPRDVSMEDTAKLLGLSARSLRRHLSAEGRSYNELVHEALALVAKTYLLDERRTVMETAHELGFADNTSFHRAFKRWTGLTPCEYRRRQSAVHAQRALS